MAATQKDQVTIQAAKHFANVPWCEDYERMISGMLYNSLVPELMEGRFRARQAMQKYNHYFPDDSSFESLAADREKMLRNILGQVGEGVFIEPPLYLDYGCNVSIGQRFYAGFNLVILDCGIVKIGDRCMFGPNVSIYSATHETEVQSRREDIEYAENVSIGSDCWIGGDAKIMAGVNIGKGCTIGAGSVVTKDVPDFSVAVGCPAKVVKKVTPVPDL